jgi:hypothetical protein
MSTIRRLNGFLWLFQNQNLYFGWILGTAYQLGKGCKNGVIKVRVLCVFYRSCIKGRYHLFFQCGFSKRIWKEIMSICKEIMSICLVDDLHTKWDDIMSSGLSSVLQSKRSWFAFQFCC